MPTANNNLRRDPTRTLLLRKRFEADVTKRYAAIAAEVIKLVEREDAFGVGPKSDGGLSEYLISNAGRWQFQSNPDKIASFKKWFAEQIRKHILTVDDANEAEPWNATYTKSAYKSGGVKSFIAAAKALKKKIVGGFGATKEEFLSSAFDSPEAVSKIKLIYTRAYDQLKNVTAAMEGRITRVLSNAIAQGQGPREVARTLNKEVVSFGLNRSRTVARTELIHAHAEGQLDTLERLGVKNVKLQVEWVTAAGACPLCAARSGDILTIQEARGLIPYHPNCRCAWVPYVDAFDVADKKKKTVVVGRVTIPRTYEGAKVSQKAVKQKMKDLGVTRATARTLTGAPTEASVKLAVNEDGHLIIHAEGVDDNAGKYKIIRNVIDKKTIENVSMTVEKQGTGFGSKAFVDQVRTLQSRGFESINTFAAKSKTLNGYKIWPKMGYDGPIPETVAALRDNPPPGGATLLSDLMRTPEGRAWWEEHGRGVDAVFDLTKGSLSLRVLNAYAKKKGY